MKRDNTNPIYLTEYMGTLFGLAGSAMGTNGAISTGIKYGRLRMNTDKVLKAYPTPTDLKNALLKINNKSAINLASKIDPNMTDGDYYRFVQKYICGNRTGSWILNALLPFSVIYQGAKAISDTGDTAYDKIIDSLD